MCLINCIVNNLVNNLVILVFGLILTQSLGRTRLKISSKFQALSSIKYKVKMGEEIKFATSALAEYVTDANEVLEFKMVIELFNVGKRNYFSHSGAET